MNKFKKSVVSLAAFTGSFAAVGGVVQAENSYPGDGDYTVRDLSDSERDTLVDKGLLTCSVKPEIRNALGIITLQEEYSERGYTRSGIDGVDGKEFCKDTLKIQLENELYADGVVGNQVVDFLGGMTELINEHGIQTNSSKKTFDPKVDCPKSSSCDIKIDLTSQRMSIINTMGVTVWNIPVQSGKLGKESRSGTGKLGPVEYGPGRNPERKSIDYPEATLVNPRSIGNGGQKIHGSYSFNPNATNIPNLGSAGCYRVLNENSFVIAQMPTGTDVVVTGAKPGTKQRYF